MKAAHANLVVAAFAAWHENHEAARHALDSGLRLIEHCALETLFRIDPPASAASFVALVF